MHEIAEAGGHEIGILDLEVCRERLPPRTAPSRETLERKTSACVADLAASRSEASPSLEVTAKRQKTGADSSATTKEGGADAADTHKNAQKRDTSKIPPYEYVCIHRPFFDFKAQTRLKQQGNDEEDEDEEDEDEEDKVFVQNKKAWEAEKPLSLQPAVDRKDHKWIIMWEGWKTFCELQTKAKYCDPDRFGMHIYNDYRGWGLQELMEHQMVAFDKVLKKKDESSFDQMWAIISALGLWLNEEDLGDFINNEYGQKTCALTALMGCALLTALSAIKDAKEPKANSKFVDLPLVLSCWLEFSHDLPDYGIEGDAVFWRSEVASYFEKASLDANKSATTAAKRLRDLAEENDEEDAYKSKRTKKDPWAWAARFREYKRDHAVDIAKSKYDITKTSKQERASYAYNGKDPLADVPAHVLKQGLLDFA
ncbi:hypothetical protein BDV96DRAFT_645194 [Lophiotrema nucula]|uniref:Uncharacterized protein n=1 Tax=Lophiotrema nucula TaxID=690887 RepID=A0A6A5ZDG7_9PLEO|nr:hypothetical protein BDV96DRAFT_645194 [Lophiotrema nucula]